MNYRQWEWKCSACREVFRGGTAKDAEDQFLAHAREAHNPKTLVSFNTEQDREGAE